MSLKRLGQITLRLNHEIVAGTDWEHVRSQRFQQADLILLLISPSFIASDYHYGIEMRHALEKHEAGHVSVIPIILRPVAFWEKTPFGKLQVLPKNGKAISLQRNRDAAFVDVVKEIGEVVAILFARKQGLVFARKAGEGIFPKFTRIIGPLCITCGARNPLGVVNCENCGDLLLTNAVQAVQKAHSSDLSEDEVTEMLFSSNPVTPDQTKQFKCPYCGISNPVSEEFCSECGAYLHEPIAADADVLTPMTSVLVPNTQLQAGRYVVMRILGQGVFYYPTLSHFIIELGTMQERYHYSDPIC